MTAAGGAATSDHAVVEPDCGSAKRGERDEDALVSHHHTRFQVAAISRARSNFIADALLIMTRDLVAPGSD